MTWPGGPESHVMLELHGKKSVGRLIIIFIVIIITLITDWHCQGGFIGQWHRIMSQITNTELDMKLLLV